MTTAQYQKLKSFMQNLNYTHTDEWLSDCFAWVKDNYPPAEVTDAFLQAQVSEQWLTADLEEMGSKILPANLEQTRCTVLKGRFALQVNQLRDIGDSSYKQYNKLKKTDLENDGVEAKDSNQYKPTWEPKTRRCLYLSMTDGSQNVFGLEMSTISTLTLAVKPGAKILIIGPVECRRGVFQLKPLNVKILGGEVENLAVTNSVENVLARILNQAENPSVAGSAITGSQLNRLTTSSANSTQATQYSNYALGEFPDGDDDFDTAFAADGFSDDDIFMDIDENALMASAISQSNVNTEVIPHPSEAITQPIPNSFYHPQSVPRTGTQNTTLRINESLASNRNDEAASTFNSTFQSGQRIKPSVPPPSNVHTIPQERKPTVKKLKHTAKGKPGPSSKSSGFKNARTENGKQLKIEMYLKPMPVIIDPPTPERQARKLAKKLKTDTPSITSNIEESAIFNNNSTKRGDVKVAVVDPISGAGNDNDVINVNEDEDETQFVEEGSDDSLMELVESAIAEQLKPEISDSIKSYDSSTEDDVVTPALVSKHPYVFIAQIHDNWDHLCGERKVLHVKACVTTLLSNLQMQNGQWTLEVCINDGSEFLNCTVSSELLNNMIGFAPNEMKQLKKAPDGKEKIATSIKQLTKTLIHCNGIFGVEVGKKPLLVSYSEVMLHHIAALKERLTYL